MGGREYACEPPQFVNGELRSFSYKALNVAVQGSSADLTKQAMVTFADGDGPGRLRFSIHDELVVSAPEEAAEGECARLVAAMEGAGEALRCEPAMDVPLVAKGRIGRSLAEVKG